MGVGWEGWGECEVELRYAWVEELKRRRVVWRVCVDDVVACLQLDDNKSVIS